MPKFGYTKLFEVMLKSDNIKIVLNTEWEDIKEKVISKEKLFFTGRIDQYFKEQFGKLQYRSLRFEFETLDQEYFQEFSQENYPSLDIPYTRIVEYKHATKQKHPKTTISREYATWEGEPYYPVPSEPNRIIYEKYQAITKDLENQNIFFVGRLANYKYFNMDQAFRNSLDIFSKLENKGKL
jgi:UDP-galactopyranose mutase